VYKCGKEGVLGLGQLAFAILTLKKAIITLAHLAESAKRSQIKM